MREITVINTVDYGRTVLKLDVLLKNAGITKTKLATLANVDYRVIKRIFDGNLVKLDLDVFSRICYVLECEASDIIEYQPPFQSI